MALRALAHRIFNDSLLQLPSVVAGGADVVVGRHGFSVRNGGMRKAGWEFRRKLDPATAKGGSVSCGYGRFVPVSRPYAGQLWSLDGVERPESYLRWRSTSSSDQRATFVTPRSKVSSL